MNELITIIVPVYNVKKYLEQSLESIFHQTYKNIEIILIDDGSTDGSENICDEYSKKDSRFKVIHKDNEGVSIARNVGLDNANGKYITFIDSDDYVDEKYIENLYIQSKSNNADISITGTQDFKDDFEIIIKSRPYESILNKEKAIKGLLSEKYFTCVVWGKLYKKELWDNIIFNPYTRIAEDFEVIYLLLKKANIISINTKDLLYFYRIRTDSTIASKYNKDFENEIYLTEKIKEDVMKNFPKIYDYAIKRYIRINITCLLKYYKENKNFKGVEHLKENIKKYKLKKYTKATFQYKLKIIIILYFDWYLKKIFK